MPPRRIAYVLKVFPKLSETFIAGELAELRQRGIELRILSLQPPRGGVRHDIVARAGLDQITTYEPEKFSAVIQEFRPEMVHAHFATEATEMAIELATEHELPFTFTAHGYDIHRKPPADFAARAAAAAAVVTVSQANAVYMAETFAVPRSHMRVIPCGVDTDRFCPVEDKKSASAELPLIVCVARLVPVKNLELMLLSYAGLRDRGVNFRAALIGDGPCRAGLEELRGRLGLSDIVQMPGAAEQSEVVSWWQRSTVGVLASDQEGMPVSLMEAAACGVPVVATKVGGVPELVEDGVTGLVVPAGDAEALAAGLERLLADGELRGRMGREARRRAEEKFSVKRQVDQLIALWSELLERRAAATVFVSDPFGAVADSGLHTLALALNPVEAKREFKRHLPRLSGENGKLRLKAIRVSRYKPGRRCVVEYDLRLQRAEGAPEKVALIGKVRVRRFGKEGYRVLDRMWNGGFDAGSADGISVPEPIGVIPRFQMWLQRKVPGETATRLLGGADGVDLARRIAEAIHKLHRANIPTERRHTMADELRILHECLARVVELKPGWTQRRQRMLDACDRLGASVPEPRECGIHRDFYPAQVVVDGPRIYLIDFDLYCWGDPALDAGNFLGHLTEQALRELGDARALAAQEKAFEERFVELSGAGCRAAIQAYTTLTLVRHIYLSTLFSERQKVTQALLDLCERRLAGQGQ